MLTTLLKKQITRSVVLKKIGFVLLEVFFEQKIDKAGLKNHLKMLLL